MRIYKYHIYIYSLWQKYKNKPFCTTEAHKVILPTALDFLYRKKLIEGVTKKRAKDIRPEIKEWHPANWSFWMINQKGELLIEQVEKNSDLVAKRLLLSSLEKTKK